MKYLLGGVSLLALFACASAQPAHAQQSTVVTTCGAQSIPTAQGTSGTYIDVTGNLCTNATGSGGAGAVYGPTAGGSPAANPPVLIGGTVDGTTTGTVENLKVDSSHQAATHDADLLTAAQSAIPAGTNVIGYTTPDPCSQISKSGGVINLTASGQIITGTAAKKTYICSVHFVSATAQNIALVEGTGSTCATNIFGLAGGTTAATGWNLSANGGMTLGSGLGTVVSPSADSNATAANVCLLLSGSGQTSGQITYVQQ